MSFDVVPVLLYHQDLPPLLLSGWQSEQQDPQFDPTLLLPVQGTLVFFPMGLLSQTIVLDLESIPPKVL